MLKRYVWYIVAGIVLCSGGISIVWFGAGKKYDLSLVGLMLFPDGLGRQSIWIMDCLQDDLSMNFIPVRLPILRSSLVDVPPAVASLARNPDRRAGSVAFFTDILVRAEGDMTKWVPKESLIKIASTMFEATAIPDTWVTVLNDRFDAAVVPDPWLVSVYKNSGVTIPVFVLPLGLYLEDFLERPVSKTGPGTPFTFGNTCSMDIRKDHRLLIDAFHHEFGNNPNVKLRINSKFFDPVIKDQIHAHLAQLSASNIELTHYLLPADNYRDFMESLDCYVTFSWGEGFSIPPREALALGIPLILSNNTAHKIIADTGLVRAVPANKLVPLNYAPLKGKEAYGFACEFDDACRALRDVYSNYKVYQDKAREGRVWVRRYLKESLRPFYKTLFKPKKIVLGTKNSIMPDYLETDSVALYTKYKKLLDQTGIE